MKRTILIVILLLGLGAAGVFAFFQNRDFVSLQENSTEVVAALEASSTQAVNLGIATETALAESAYATYTQAAQNYSELVATSQQDSENFAASSSQAADEAMATGTEFANFANATGTELADSAYSTGTEIANSANATGTALAELANSSSTQAAEDYNNVLATQVAFSTESANVMNTQSAVASSAAEIANNAQSTLVAQNLTISSTLEASGWIGEGIFGASAALPDGFELYEGIGYEIALPESFDGADLNDNPRHLFRRLDSLGFEATSDYLREQDDNFLFFGIDTNLVNEFPRATVSILRDIPAIETDLGGYLGGAYVGIEGNAALIITDEMPLNGQVAGRGIVEQQFENGSVRQMQYIFQAENSFYVITFTSPVSEFVLLRPALEQSAGTFRLRD